MSSEAVLRSLKQDLVALKPQTIVRPTDMMTMAATICALLLLLVPSVLGFSPLNSRGLERDFLVPLTTRCTWLTTTISTASTATTTLPVWAASPPPAAIEGIGGGADIRIPLSATASDVTYPNSIEGVWQCRRIVVLVEGNADQALVSWKALGGSDDSLFTNKKVETFLTRFITNRQTGETVLDRGFELAQRSSSSSNVQWEASLPSILTYNDYKDQPVELAVIERRTEPPTDQGFGFNELVRITEKAPFGQVQRCTQVKRRYRRAFDNDGNRVVEGLEIQKTFRVLDGIAGVEIPTSTTKAQIQMTRPSSV